MRSPVHTLGYASLGAVVMAASLGWAALSPATAEDSGFWEVIRANAGVRVVAPAPGFPAVLPSALPAAPRPQIVRLPSPTLSKPVPPDPAKRENPLASLLRDPTLRYGDIVMFPDGARVFRGGPGGRHSPHDFAPVSASRDVAPSTRKMLLAMPVGENGAWSADVTGRRGRVAQRAPDVDTTGSIDKGIGKTVTVRTGRGDVRVIRVPD
jgi:hypothetical protein